MEYKITDEGLKNVLDKVDGMNSICEEGRKEIKNLLNALVGKEIEKQFGWRLREVINILDRFEKSHKWWQVHTFRLGGSNVINLSCDKNDFPEFDFREVR